MSLLSNKQIHDELIELNGWVFKNNAIKKILNTIKDHKIKKIILDFQPLP